MLRSGLLCCVLWGCFLGRCLVQNCIILHVLCGCSMRTALITSCLLRCVVSTLRSTGCRVVIVLLSYAWCCWCYCFFAHAVRLSWLYNNGCASRDLACSHDFLACCWLCRSCTTIVVQASTSHMSRLASDLLLAYVVLFLLQHSLFRYCLTLSWYSNGCTVSLAPRAKMAAQSCLRSRHCELAFGTLYNIRASYWLSYCSLTWMR